MIVAVRSMNVAVVELLLRRLAHLQDFDFKKEILSRERMIAIEIDGLTFDGDYRIDLAPLAGHFRNQLYTDFNFL